MSAKRRLKLQAFHIAEKNEAGETSLFVMNRVKPEGNLNITVSDQSGQRITVTIPMTFIPVDMSLFIDRKSLLSNQDFRRLCASGGAVIIDPDDARAAIEEHPGAKKELQRILMANRAGADFSNQTEEYVDMEGGGNVAARRQAQKEPVAEASPFVVQLVFRSKEGTEDVQDLISDLEQRSHSLELNDLEYILQHAENETLKQYVVDLIETLND